MNSSGVTGSNNTRAVARIAVKVRQHSSAINDLQAQIDALDFDTYLDGINASITAIQAVNTTQSTDINALESADITLAAATTSVSGRVTTIETNISGLEGVTLGQLKQQVIDNATDITTTQTLVSSFGAAIAGLGATDISHQEQITSNDLAQTALTFSVATLNTTVASHSTSISAQNANIATNTSGLATATSVNASQATSITNLNASVATINDYPLNDTYQIAPMQDDLTALFARVYTLENQILFSACPIGTIITWMSNTFPAGYLLCDGQSFSVGTYPNLAAALGQSSVPDLRGYFLRGWDSSGGVDPDTGRSLGSTQGWSLANHTHTYQDAALVESGTNNFAAMRNSNGGTDTGTASFYFRTTTNSTNQNPAATNTFLSTGQAGNSTESRPTNKSVNYLIRAL